MERRDTLTFRPARAPEARVMAEMSRDLIERGLGWRYTQSRVAALIADPETVALVACDPARIHGFAVMQFGDELAHLALLCVQAAEQRRGVGRRLIEWLTESAEIAGIASIQLELRADNAGALAFYRRLGFTETQQVAGYYSDSVAALRMVRRLGVDAG